jgi:hypothetical protein
MAILSEISLDRMTPLTETLVLAYDTALIYG